MKTVAQLLPLLSGARVVGDLAAASIARVSPDDAFMPGC